MTPIQRMGFFCAHLGVIFFLACASVQTPEPRDESSDFWIFLLVGQSNMAGRGDVAGVDSQVHPRVVMLDQNDTWQPARDPLHFDKPIAGVGPGLSFGKVLAGSYPEVRIGLVPCAAGGSRIEAWTPGGYHDQTDSYPYDEALRRTRRALQDGVLMGILWHQGEGNSKVEHFDGYEDKLVDLIRRFRSELSVPGIPVVMGELGVFTYEDRPLCREINFIFHTIADSDPNAAVVSADGLSCKADSIHFDAASARELGRRYARAWIGMRENQGE